MGVKMKNNYNIFTKKELAEFLSKYENNFRMIDTPFDIMVDKKMDSIMDEIDKVNKNGKQLTCEFETLKDRISSAIKIMENSEKWQRLNKEYEKFHKLRFGK